MSDILDVNLKIHELRKLREHFVEGKDGAQYLDCRIVPTPNSKYNDGILVRRVSKEDREAGIQGEVIGTVKDWSKHSSAASKPIPKNENNSAQIEGADDLPF